MQNFKFYADSKHTIWERCSFVIEADTKEEAIKKLKETTKQDGWEENNPLFEYDSCSFLYDTTTSMDIGDNDGNPTIEIYDDETGDFITDNLLEYE